MKKVISFAFVKTVPVLCGYLFLGIAFGVLLQKAGYPFLWALLSSVFIYAGSIQFVLVSFLGGNISLITIVIMTLLINSRHIFYGLSFIERFQTMGKFKPYMIFSLTDETYSILCSTKVPEYMDEKKVLFFMALFDHLYWITGSVLGGLLGEVLPFDTMGIDFAMTALFVCIFVEQWQNFHSHIPAITGMISALICLVLLGPDNFILPSLLATISILMLCKNKIEGAEGKEGLS